MSHKFKKRNCVYRRKKFISCSRWCYRCMGKLHIGRMGLLKLAIPGEKSMEKSEELNPNPSVGNVIVVRKSHHPVSRPANRGETASK